MQAKWRRRGDTQQPQHVLLQQPAQHRAQIRYVPPPSNKQYVWMYIPRRVAVCACALIVCFCLLQSSISSLPDSWKMDPARRQLRYTLTHTKGVLPSLQCTLASSPPIRVFRGAPGCVVMLCSLFPGPDPRSGKEGGERG